MVGKSNCPHERSPAVSTNLKLVLRGIYDPALALPSYVVLLFGVLEFSEAGMYLDHSLLG